MTAKGASPAPVAEPAAKQPKRNTSVLGRSFIFPPEVIDDIHIKAELGRYRMRGFSIFKRIPSWDDLTFLPGTLPGHRCRVSLDEAQARHL